MDETKYSDIIELFELIETNFEKLKWTSVGVDEKQGSLTVVGDTDINAEPLGYIFNETYYSEESRSVVHEVIIYKDKTYRKQPTFNVTNSFPKIATNLLVMYNSMSSKPKSELEFLIDDLKEMFKENE